MTDSAAQVRFASAMSNLPDTQDAIRQIATSLAHELTGAASLVVVFATAEHKHQFDAIDQQLQVLKPQVMIAATCQGVIGVRQEIERGPAISVLAATMPGAVLSAFHHDANEWQKIVDRPQTILDGCETKNTPSAMVVIADPFSTPQQEMIEAFDRAFPPIPIIGGMASGAQQAGENRLMLNGEVISSGACGLLIGGDVQVGSTVSQGCRPIGKPFVITKSQRNIVQQLGGRSALEVAQKTLAGLSERDRELATRALFVGRVIDEYKDRFGRGDFLIRNILGVDHDNGYIAVADPYLRPGQTVQFQVRDSQSAVEDLALLLEAQKVHGPPTAGLLFSCNGRGTHMFAKPHTDAETIEQSLGPIPLAGCFAMGEIGPVGNRNFIHGHTASILFFHEPNSAAATA